MLILYINLSTSAQHYLNSNLGIKNKEKENRKIEKKKKREKERAHVGPNYYTRAAHLPLYTRAAQVLTASALTTDNRAPLPSLPPRTPDRGKLRRLVGHLCHPLMWKLDSVSPLGGTHPSALSFPPSTTSTMRSVGNPPVALAWRPRTSHRDRTYLAI